MSWDKLVRSVTHNAGEVNINELQPDDNANANEMSIILPSDDDLWVALCSLAPVSATNGPFLDRQRTHAVH